MSPAKTDNAPPRRRGNFLTIMLVVAVFFILIDPRLRDTTGNAVGFVLNPLIGFNHSYPVLTIMIAGTMMVMLTTVMRHFTTDWINMAKTQAMLKHFQKEFSTARKEQNTYRMKKLQDVQPEIMKKQQAMSTKQLKMMPYTMLIVIPLFAWLFTFISSLDYWWFSTPWNPTVHMLTTEGILFGTSLFPHWILLYMVVSIPLGLLIQKAMKYLSWKERWKQRHPEIKDA